VETIRANTSRFALPAILVCVVNAGVWSFIFTGCFRHATKIGTTQAGLAPRDSTSNHPLVENNNKTATPTPAANHETPKSSAPDSVRQHRDTAKAENVKLDSSAAKPVLDTLSLRSRTDTTLSLTDTSGVKSDSISLDSLKLSRWLSEIRHDHPQAEAFPAYRYPLFLYSDIVQRSAVIDSTGKFVTARETLLGKDIRIPIQVPLDDYIKQEQKYFTEKTWQDLAHAYISKGATNAIGNLMSGITNIDIPIPSNPVLSIFGPPRINLKISGAVDVHGAWRNQKTDQQTISALGNVTNQPDFKQDVQINLDGTVGDKLSIGANWDTQNQFDYENQLHIKYTGYDDEIIKNVEAGNVSMSTNSSFIGSSQALFGIKATAQFGPLTLTGLASQQKAQGKTMTYSGGSSSQTFSLRAYDYSTNHFWIDTSYISEYEDYYQKPGHQINRPDLVITQCEVYESIFNPAGNTNVRSGVAIMDLPPMGPPGSQAANYYDSLQNLNNSSPAPPIPGKIEYGNFVKLDPSQYTIDKNIGVLTLLNSYSSDQVIAIVYQTQHGDTYGTFSFDNTSKSRLVFKLIKPANLVPGGSFAEAWRLMLKNIYPIGGLNLTPTSIKDLKILYTPQGGTAQDNIAGPNGTSVSLVHLFHLDGSGGVGSPNTFFYNEGVDIDPARGEIIMPFVKPFVEAFQQTGQGYAIDSANSYIYSSIYDTTSEIYTSDNHNLYSMSGSYVGSSSSRINLGFNLVQGSVKVLLNGTPLEPDQDYSIDYITGDLTIKNPAALVPGANVQIQYETNDLFQIASKSLTGLRGDLKINDQSGLGFTLMNYSLQSPNDKVQVGEEPMSNMILGVDGQTSLDLPFITKGLDALPLIQTAAPSKLTLHGEGAYMLPTPNTRTSPIPEDNGQGVAYLDDFEGSKRTIPLPISYSSWYIASPPKNTAIDSVLGRQIPDSTKNDYRGWLYWYNIQPPSTPSKEIWPFKDVAADQQAVTVLDVGFLNKYRGQFNRSLNIDTTLDTHNDNPNLAKLAWGGMMLDLGSNASDLVSQNINSLEIWMKIDSSTQTKGTMHIDVGQISEDVFGDGKFRSEDTTGLGIRNNDLGIDQLSDAEEANRYKWIVKNPDRPWDKQGTDPDGDDYYYSNGDYSRVNGTENNANSVNGILPDGEDLNHNRFLDQTNSYYEYNIKLDTANNKYIAGGGSKGWYQYIVPLKDTSKIVGSPSLSVVQSVRIWFDGATSPIGVRIAEMDLVGNYWRSPNAKDTTMQASVVSIFDNPGYSPPVQGLAPVDHSNPTTPITLNEQSLDLILNGLHGGDSRYVYKYNPTPLNVFHYKNLKFFVHGDPHFRYIDSTDHDADIYIRFGGDSLNFYEYRQPINPHPINTGLAPGWQDATINFGELTAIKQRRDSVNQPNVFPVPANNGIPGSTYWIQGNPSLMNISYFQIGITNTRPGSAVLLNGSVYVDELRLVNADNTPGGAYRFDASLQLADLGSLTFNFSKTDPYFHGLTTQFGTLNTQQNWAVNASLSLERLLPREWQGTSIPFAYSHSETYSNPLYLAGSDILVTEAVAKRALNLVQLHGYSPTQAASIADSLRVSSQVLRVQDSWSIPSMHLGIPSTKWYIKDILNNITLGYNWAGSKYRDTQVKMGNQWSWNFSSGYSVQFDPNAWYTPFPSKATTSLNSTPVSRSADQGFNSPMGGPETQAVIPSTAPLGQDFRIRYLPTSLSLSMSASRSLTTEDYWTQTTTRLNPTFGAQRSGGFNWQLTNNGILNPTIDYRFNITSSLYAIDVDTANGGLVPRPSSYVFRQIFLNNGLINFGTDYDYTQQFSLTTQPHLPFNLQKFFDMQASYNSAYHWSNSLQQAQYGKGAGTNGTLQLGSTIRLKMLTDPWFAGGSSAATTAPTETYQPQPPRSGARGRGVGREEFETPADTTASTGFSQSSSMTNRIGNIANILIKVPFLDFESISVNFSSANASQNGGLPSLRPGMSNFFKVPFIQESNPALGPSQLYQLGLISDPYSKLVFFKKNGFPFFGFGLTPTTRIPGPGTQISDNFSNTNSLDIRTSRNLWQGARIDLTWHVGWSYNRNILYQTDASGRPIDSTDNITLSGQVNRSFFTVPPVFVFSEFKNGINQFNVDYQQMLNDPTDTRTPQQKMSDAFVKGFETLPILDKIFGPYMPRMNYSFTWDGLEQLPLFKTFATHVSFNNAYQSTYSENWSISNNDPVVVGAQTISYGFQPLAGLNIAFKSIGDATISGSILYNTSTQYSLNPSNSSIAEQYTGQLTITADYAKKGFSIPLFGLNLQNDVDISASFSRAASTQSQFSIDTFNPNGTPISGSTQNTLEIRFRYDVSQRVTASIYYRNTKLIPTVQGSQIFGTTTNEAGIDVHVSIAG
jgi:hypothetical protein